MDSDDLFWVKIWGYIFILIAMIGGMITVQQITSNQLKTRMVLEGASPMEANCALASTGNTSTVCVILSVKGGK